MKLLKWMIGGVAVVLVGAGCLGEPSSDVTGSSESTQRTEREEGAGLFNRKTFSGNGRTCRTCHTPESAFTLSPEDVQARYAADPRDPLFLHDGTDDGRGNGITRILADATILMTRSLPAHVVLEDDRSTRSITVPRGIPTLLDVGVQNLQTPAFMADGRFDSLEDQALGAVLAHYQARKRPTLGQRETIARFQTSDAFFSSPELADLAFGGPDVDLPEGTTDSERRGREFFVSRPQPAPGSGERRHLTCAGCHSGPLLNEVLFSAGPVADGHRFMDVFVSTLRARRGQLMDLEVTHTDGSVNTLTTADPGQLLTEGSFRCQPCTTNRVGFVTCGGCIPCSNFVFFNPELAGRDDNVCALLPGRFPDGTLRPAPTGNVFKIPTLRGISRTAPYFHDNSARTLEEVVDHYQDFFEIQFRRTEGALADAEDPLDGRLSPQDVEDIIAFMRLL